MQRNIIHLDKCDDFAKLQNLAQKTIEMSIKTKLGTIPLKRYNHFYKMTLPNNDPLYVDVKNLFYKTNFQDKECDFTVTVHDVDILYSLFTPVGELPTLWKVSNEVFKFPEFHSYVSFKKILQQDHHVTLTINKKDVYRFDSPRVIYYNNKIINPRSEEYIFLIHLFDHINNSI